MRVLTLAVEAAPWAKVGGLSEVAGSLPRALFARHEDLDVRLMVPMHAGAAERAGPLERVARVEIGHAGGPLYAEAYRTRSEGVTVDLVTGPPIPLRGPGLRRKRRPRGAPLRLLLPGGAGALPGPRLSPGRGPLPRLAHLAGPLGAPHPLRRRPLLQGDGRRADAAQRALHRGGRRGSAGGLRARAQRRRAAAGGAPPRAAGPGASSPPTRSPPSPRPTPRRSSGPSAGGGWRAC